MGLDKQPKILTEGGKHPPTLSRHWKGGDVVQVETWVSSSGKNGMHHDWLVHGSNTGEVLMRASSVWMMMNKLTRRLSKMLDEVRAEIGPHFIETRPVTDEDGRKLSKLDDNTAKDIRRGLTISGSR
ncbi:hypothetical protein KSS87_021447 [Heliosperma pusillum]|nr:hypothetical protein KSS87_021447 [Heliosperma pusillum]